METGVSSRVWLEIAPELRERLGADRYERWLAPLSLLGASQEEVRLGAPNKFWLEWIEDRYLRAIAEVLERRCGQSVRVSLAIDPQLFCRMRKSQREILADVSRGPAGDALPGRGLGEAAPAGLRPNGGWPAAPFPESTPGETETLESFVTGPSNVTARNAALQVVGCPGRVYNPLFIHGPSGLGKTHLLRGITWGLCRQSPHGARYLTGEEFLNHFVSSLRSGTLAGFRKLYRSPQVLVIDDVHLLGNKLRTQEEFLHTFDTLKDAGHQIVLSSDCHARDIENLLKPLLGRFISGLAAPINRPDFQTRLEILRQKARFARVPFNDEVLHLVAQSVRSNVRELIGAFTYLSASSFQEGRTLDLPAAEKLLAEAVHSRRINLKLIAERVARHYGIPPETLSSPSRQRSLSLARQVAMFLGRKYTDHSLAEIGKFFGDRNHTSVKSAESRVARLLETNPALRKDLEKIIDSFED